jgi:hypothetical protein
MIVAVDAANRLAALRGLKIHVLTPAPLGRQVRGRSEDDGDGAETVRLI